MGDAVLLHGCGHLFGRVWYYVLLYYTPHTATLLRNGVDRRQLDAAEGLAGAYFFGKGTEALQGGEVRCTFEGVVVDWAGWVRAMPVPPTCD